MTTRTRAFAVAVLAVTAGLVLFAVSSWSSRHGAGDGGGRTLEIEMRATAGTVAQVFWSDDGSFDGQRMVALPLQADGRTYRSLSFPIPRRGASMLRFDPIDTAGDVDIRRLSLLDDNGRFIRTWTASEIVPVYQVASVAESAAGVHVTTVAGASDPILLLPAGCAQATTAIERLSFVTPPSLAVVASAAALVVLAGSLLILAPLFARPAWPTSLWLTGLFLFVCAGKALLNRQYPLTVPFWDQWDAEGRAVLVPYFQCSLRWQALFNLHNEHRLFFTRLLSLVGVVLNGQWDPRLQLALNALSQGLTAVLLTATAWMAIGRRHLDACAVVVALLFTLPFAWENALQPFQSAFYLLVLFSIPALWLTITRTPWSVGWWLGWLLALCGLFTSAGGIITPIGLLGLAVALGLLRRDGRAQARSMVPIAGAIALLGWLVSSPPLPHHAVLRAHSLRDLLVAFGHNLAWPWVSMPLMALPMWLPFALFTFWLLRRRESPGPSDLFLLALGGWVVSQAAAIAVGRGGEGAIPASRYQDFFSLGLFTNWLVSMRLLDWHHASGQPRQRWAVWALAGWLVLGTAGTARLVDTALPEMSVWAGRWEEEAANVRRYLYTSDRDALLSKRSFQLPYPDAQSLAQVLDVPEIQRILPAAVRRPLVIQLASGSADAFAADGVYPYAPRDPLARTWGSFTGEGDPAVGRMESGVLPPCRAVGYLRFMTSGYVGLDGLTLAVRDEGSRRERRVVPRRIPHEDWVTADVRCPTAPFRVVASDERGDHWLAFREPVEIGAGSIVADALIEGAPLGLAVALAILMLAARLSGRSMPVPAETLAAEQPDSGAVDRR